MEFVKWVSLADSVEINWCGRSRSKKILIPLNRRNDLKNRKLACTSIIAPVLNKFQEDQIYATA